MNSPAATTAQPANRRTSSFSIRPVSRTPSQPPTTVGGITAASTSATGPHSSFSDVPALTKYEAAAAMGLAVADLRAMSLWQFAAYLDGFNRARGAEAQTPTTPAPMTQAEADGLWDWIRSETGDRDGDRA